MRVFPRSSPLTRRYGRFLPACRVLLLPQWGRYLRGGDQSFHVVWQTEMEVELERTKKKLRGVIAPIPTPNDYLDTVVDDVVSLRWSKNMSSHGPLGKASI